MTDVEVVGCGPYATVQDLGRPGLAHLGVACSGAADRSSLRLANRLVGNAEDAAGVEVLAGGLALRCSGALVAAVTGAPVPLRIDGRAVGVGTALHLHAGQVLRLGQPVHGLRTYVAVAGGVAVQPVLGSRSTDSMSGLGPPALATGQRLPVGSEHGEASTVEVPPLSQLDVVTLRCRLGPRHDWFAGETLETFLTATWTVGADADRVGVRLEGPTLAYDRDGQLPSEGMPHGAVQVPPSGQPIVFLPDHGTVGGYPVVAVVSEPGLDLLAQAVPGTAVRFARG